MNLIYKGFHKRGAWPRNSMHPTSERNTGIKRRRWSSVMVRQRGELFGDGAAVGVWSQQVGGEEERRRGGDRREEKRW